MASKIKNIILFTVIAAVLILIYIFFIKKAPEEANLTSSPITTTSTSGDTSTIDQNSALTRDFLSVLLNVKNIKLDDAIFSDASFNNLRDSSILLVASGDEGRPNPFAPIGSDPVVVPVAPAVITCTPPQVLDTSTNTCATPAVLTCVLPEVLDLVTNTCVAPAPVCKSPKVLNPSTNKCVTPLVCKSPKILDVETNTCITPPPAQP
ncbi:MAG: hypothetical protein WCS86_01425 [Candidatus Paceibacterota bacterium]